MRLVKELEGTLPGKKYANALVHVSPCLYPIITGQDNFKAIAANGAKDGWLTFLPENQMDKLKELAKALGIEVQDGMAEDALYSAITTKMKERDESIKSLSTQIDELKKTEKKPEDNWPEEAKERIKALEASNRKTYHERLVSRVSGVISASRATPGEIKKLGLDKIDLSKLNLSKEGVDPDIEAKLATLEALEQRHSLTQDLSRNYNSGDSDDDARIANIAKIAKEDLKLIGEKIKE